MRQSRRLPFSGWKEEMLTGVLFVAMVAFVLAIMATALALVLDWSLWIALAPLALLPGFLLAIRVDLQRAKSRGRNG